MRDGFYTSSEHATRRVFLTQHHDGDLFLMEQLIQVVRLYELRSRRGANDDVAEQLDARATLIELFVTENIAVLRRPHRVELVRLMLQPLDVSGDGFLGSARVDALTLLLLRQQAIHLLTHHLYERGGDAGNGCATRAILSLLVHRAVEQETVVDADHALEGAVAAEVGDEERARQRLFGRQLLAASAGGAFGNQIVARLAVEERQSRANVATQSRNAEEPEPEKLVQVGVALDRQLACVSGDRDGQLGVKEEESERR